MRDQRVTYDDMEFSSGVLRTTIKAWRHKNSPSLANIEACFGVLGWNFVPIPSDKAVPAEILDAIRPIAERYRLTRPEAVQIMCEIVTGLDDRRPKPAAETGEPEEFRLAA